MKNNSYSSGIMTNSGKGLSEEEVKEMMDSKIISLNIQALPLINKKELNCFVKYLCKIPQLFCFHPRICSITSSHFAIELILKNDYTIIIEYGQYLTQKSENEKLSSDSYLKSGSKDCRKEDIDLSYYYINGDGARLTILNKKVFEKYQDFINNYNDLVQIYSRNEISLIITAYQYYFFPTILNLLTNIKGSRKNPRLSSIEDYNIIECEIENEISLGELCNSFKGEEWKAKNYNLYKHNCQDFVAKVIKILKAKRKYVIDLIRTREKFIFPNCIISSLRDNEGFSSLNFLGSIPLFGPFYDLYAYNHLKNKNYTVSKVANIK